MEKVFKFIMSGILFLTPLLQFHFRCIYTLFTGQNRDLAVMTKLFEGFLDDGPQFVLRLVVVVLFGIHIGQGKGNFTVIHDPNLRGNPKFTKSVKLLFDF